MRLQNLLDDEVRLIGPGEVEISGLACDSRAVLRGDLFAAMPGSREDGRRFADAAIRGGAAALLGDATLPDLPVPRLVATDTRRAFARIVARFHPGQPATVVAVTGTSGKTSTATFVRELWAARGHAAASLGTLGLERAGRPAVPTLTTPDPLTLHRLLAGLKAEGVERLCLEASSHGLDQRRLDGVRLAAGAFTNLSRDHLDYHGTSEAYLAAKTRLFATLLPRGAAAVLNADVPEFAGLRAIAAERGLEVVDYGRAARRLRLLDLTADLDGLRLRLEIDGRAATLASPLMGAFQAHNLLAAFGLVMAAGEPAAALLPLLPRLRGAPGRMQRVARHREGAIAFVDYAHKPAALEHALMALRPYTPGRLVAVFGCGGDRDPGKRSVMGAIAAGIADRVIVTDDNPRGEDPAAIRAAILAASPLLEEIGDRAVAIRTAFAGLEPGDALLVAGKGHETGQQVGDRVLPFDDAAILRDIARHDGGEAL